MSEGPGKRRRTAGAQGEAVGTRATVDGELAEAEARAHGTSAFTVAAMKRLMTEDDEVGRVSDGAAVLMAKCCELFLERMLRKSVENARVKDRKWKEKSGNAVEGLDGSDGVEDRSEDDEDGPTAVAVTEVHFREAVQQDPLCDFLIDVVGAPPATGDGPGSAAN